jgi:hypothetical protein
MRVDELAAYDTSEPIPMPEQQNYLFSVKIVLAEGLAMPDGSTKLPDSFVILSDEHGNRSTTTPIRDGTRRLISPSEARRGSWRR